MRKHEEIIKASERIAEDVSSELATSEDRLSYYICLASSLKTQIVLLCGDIEYLEEKIKIMEEIR